jgi:hypothetical protein
MARKGRFKMSMLTRLRGVGISLLIGLIAIPIALVMTLLLMPFWSWIESTLKIEAVGHSGPAAWCYLASYFVALTGGGLIWQHARRPRNRRLFHK